MSETGLPLCVSKKRARGRCLNIVKTEGEITPSDPNGATSPLRGRST